ncbi:hypothetical protein [Candidatus Albibeggiatoa sp. nov. NOAA]|uniref:hypothetical protein n=1 Tax=Candidatus Albibeggiatoa sp. nov. NOAA TaxID=3162724 RepID=UPI0032FC5FA3|nr:hypothetical protein [Thiotrichaceae bacterium]
MQFRSHQLWIRQGWYTNLLRPFTTDLKVQSIWFLALCLGGFYFVTTAYAIPFTNEHCYVADYSEDYVNCECIAATVIDGVDEYGQMMIYSESDNVRQWYRTQGRSRFEDGGFVIWAIGDDVLLHESIYLTSDYSIPMYNEHGASIRYNYAIFINGFRKNAEYYFKNISEEDDYFRCSTNDKGLFKEVTTGFTFADIKALRKLASNSDGSSKPLEPTGHQLSIASLYTHVQSTPSGIDCKYGEGDCFHIFDQGEQVQLEIIDINNEIGLKQGEYDIVWEGSLGCDKQRLLMNTHRSCLVRVYGKHDASQATQPENQLNFLNFSGHDLLLGDAKDLILGFILQGEGSTEVKLHADILETGVLPKLRLNQLLQNADGHYYGHLLAQHQQNESFILNQTIQAGIYTLQMSSEQKLGRGLAGISLQDNTLNLTNLSVRGYLQDQLALNFIVDGTGTQQIQIVPQILEGEVETQLSLLNLATGETIAQADSIEVKAGAYAAVLSATSGQGVALISVNLLK